MRNKLFIILALVFCSIAQFTFAAVTPAAAIPAYYADANGKSGAQLWSTVSTIANKGFHSLGYSGLWAAYQQTDVYPADSVGKAGKIWDMYGECAFTYSSDQCGSYSHVCDCYNREHSIPKSWFGGGTGGIGCDIFHLVPTDGQINGTRSNDEFGEIDGEPNYYGNTTGTAGSWSTPQKTIASTAGEIINGSGKVFEPKPQYKGDFARGYMGTIIKWQLSNMTTDNQFFSGKYDAEHFYGFSKKAVVLMMKWHREDPVSQKEIDRNNGIQATQGNRNPFIDYPYLAEYIWGEHAGEEVDMSLLMSSSDVDFLPGISSGLRDHEVPPEPYAMYGVTWSANGEVLSVDSIADQVPILNIPPMPESCSSESDVFMGWTTAPIDGTSDEAPLLYKEPFDFPPVTEDVTYYAVFAKQESNGSAAPATYIFDADHQAGWTCTASKKNSYWLLESGRTIVSPEIDLMGLESITVKMRTYGGSQYNELTISEDDGVLGTVTATAGSTMTEYTWNCMLYIAGTSAITFSSDYGTGKGIGIQEIVINATGAGITYSRFITSCQGTTEVELVVNDEAAARKILVGGQIYILLGGQLFNLQGQRVK